MSEAKKPDFTPPGPGPEHAVFAADAGPWDVGVEARPVPGAPAVVSSGIATSWLVCGGMWLVSDFKNETSGFEGHGIYGFDPVKQKYVGIWVDSMRTFLAP